MGPVATQMLGDYGADVIKIERPPTGDLSRTSIPDDPAGLVGPVYCSLNRNKRSVVFDLRKPDERAALMDLIRGADVVVNNFRAGVMERMGLGYDELKKINPRLIYAVGTGFGLTGPYAHKGGQDVLAQAMSGVMARRSRESDPLSVYATTFADYSAGMHLVQGVLLALLQREKTGRGQQFNVSLLDSMIAAQTQEAATQMMRGDGAELGRDAAVRRVRDQRRRAGDGRRVQGRSREGHRHGARHRGPRGRSALHDPCAADGEQAGAAGAVHGALQDQHHGALDRQAGRAGPAVRAGAQPRRGARRRAGDDQRHDHARRRAWSRPSRWSARRSTCRMRR